MEYLIESYGNSVNSLQAEIGMYTQINQLRIKNYELNIEQRSKIEKIRGEIGKLENKNIKGFEPKEYLITLHCQDRVEEVEELVKKYDINNELFCWWNEEAYDIGVNGVNKATGLQKLIDKLELKMVNVMTVGNGINDENMTAVAGVDISTDQKHLQADFVAYGEELGGEKVIDKILGLMGE
jgi:hydroxymethylpyrimidine pyrophosphatase-like HAD family hydrolase